MAAMFDVYAAIMIKEKNHQAPPTSLPATDLGAKAVYWCMKVPSAKKRLFAIPNGFFTLVPITVSSILHSHGENLDTRNKTMLTPK